METERGRETGPPPTGSVPLGNLTSTEHPLLLLKCRPRWCPFPLLKQNVCPVHQTVHYKAGNKYTEFEFLWIAVMLPTKLNSYESFFMPHTFPFGIAMYL